MCETCQAAFTAPRRRRRRFCGRKCAAVHTSQIYSDGRLLGELNPNFGNPKVKDSWAAGAYADRPLPAHGAGKGGYHGGVWMRSSWELRFAEKLDEVGIEWLYEPKRFPVGEGRTYTPDFFIPKLNLWIEIKGYWLPKALLKFEQFKTLHPDEEIIVIGGELWHSRLNV